MALAAALPAAVPSEARSGPAPLSLDERVRGMRAIEEVYWAHREWPKDNPTPQPPLGSLVPDAAIEQKALDALRQSSALGELWNQPVTAALLQAEMDRMAMETKDPVMLRELWAALDNDPVRIAECLARPLLVERLARSAYAFDPRFHGDLRKRAEGELAAAGGVSDLRRGTGRFREMVWVRQAVAGRSKAGRRPGAALGEADWAAFRSRLAAAFGWSPSAPLPHGRFCALQEDADRFYALAVLEEIPDSLTVASVVWAKRPFDDWWREAAGGFRAEAPAEGESYALPALRSFTCTDDSWTDMPGPPSARTGATAVWISPYMVVWGGQDVTGPLNTGGRYSVATNTWTPTTLTGAPSARSRHAAAADGSRMMVWGGVDGSGNFLGTGALYSPSSNAWTPMDTTGAPSARADHALAYVSITGASLYFFMVFGGQDGTGILDGSNWKAYVPDNAAGSRWVDLSVTGTPPAGRIGHTLTPDGSTGVVVWGGKVAGGAATNSGAYLYQDIGGVKWATVPTSGNCPSARYNHSAVWSGSRVVVWGGQDGTSVLGTGGQYNIAGTTWEPVSTTGAPSARQKHSAVWASSRMVVWGGASDTGETTYLASGGRLNPSAGGGTWEDVSTTNEPSARMGHAAVSNGTLMVVWGGRQSGSSGALASSGGEYDPGSNAWTATGNAGVPEARYGHQTVWTGTEMILWGGQADSGEIDTGGRYTPATNAWTPTDTADPDLPEPRVWHSAVWTGTEMIVWGGSTADFGTYYRSGGRYNPSSDTWTPTNLTGAPEARYDQQSVWTGSRMVVWGGWGGALDDLLNTGGIYNPSTDTWVATDPDGAPAGREYFTAVYGGGKMLVYGGMALHDYLVTDTGGAFDPSADPDSNGDGEWSGMAASGGTLDARWDHTAVWNGSRMVVWGGSNDASEPFGDGAKYDPVGDSWTALSGTGAPEARSLHAAAWSGRDLFIWGGKGASDLLDTGGRFTDAGGSWAALAATGAPRPRQWPSGLWIGNYAAFWGGQNTQAIGSGGLYCACTAAPGQATTPSPADSATTPVCNPPAALTWVGEGVPKTYDVTLTTPGSGSALLCDDTAATSCDPGALSPHTTPYQWRVDSANTCGSSTGTTWQFYLQPNPSPPGSPSPADAATACTADPLALAWTPGANSERYTTVLNAYAMQESGTGTGSANLWTDSTKSWITDVWAGHILVDGAGVSFPIASNTATTLTVSGTPTSGAYSISDPPTTARCTNAASASCSVAGLSAGNLYYWKVTARNTCGDFRGQSTAGPVWSFYNLGTPAAPTVTDIAECSTSGVSVAWAPVEGADGYDLQVDGGTVVTDVTSAHAYQPGNTSVHTYALRAKRGGTACAWGPSAEGTDINNTPGAPVITAVTDNNGCAQSGVTITFTPGNGATRHDLWVDGVEAVQGISSPYGYNPGTTASKSYVVRAVKGGCHADSAPYAFADLDDTPGPATGLSVSDVSACTYAVAVTYTAGTPAATQYDLYVDGLLAVANYSSGATYATNGSAHTYVIQAVKNTCTADASAGSYADTTNYTPTDVTISAVTDSSGACANGITITFSGGGPNAEWFDLYWDADGYTAVLKSEPGPATSMTYTPGTAASRTYKIRARNATHSCTGNWSNAMAGADQNEKPSAPVLQSVTDTSGPCAAGVTVTFTAGSPATSHELWVDGSQVATGITSPYAYNPGGTASKNYLVRAVNGSCTTDSNTVSAADVNDTPGAVTLGTITDSSGDCALGIQVPFSGGAGATIFLLLRNGTQVASVASSPFNYTPPDTASYTYVVRAVKNTCTVDSGGSAFADTNNQPSAITGTTFQDLSECATSGIRITFSGGTPAASYTLYRAGNPVDTAYTSGKTYQPPDTASYSYFVRAVNGSCTADSATVSGADVNNYPSTDPAITSITDEDKCATSGIRVYYTGSPDATRHDLLRNGSVVVSGYVSGALYQPLSTASSSYQIRAVRGGCTRTSGSFTGTDENNTPATPGAPSVSDLDGCAQSGVQISWGSVSGATSYDVLKDGSAVVYSGASTSTTHNPGDTASHTYQVRAVKAGTGYSCNGSYSTASAFADGNVKPGVPSITGITDGNACAQSGFSIAFTGGAGATSHNLVRDSVVAATGITSPYIYNPNDGLSHTYSVQAVAGSCTTDSPSWAYADGNATPVQPAITGITDNDPNYQSGITITYGFGTGAIAYSNAGGSGNRSASLAVTSDILSGTPSELVDGVTTGSSTHLNGLAVQDRFIRFDFGANYARVIQEAKLYQSTSDTHGSWQWQGSNDGSTWTPIGSPFTLGGASTQTITALSGNTGGYRYYQLIGVSGTASSVPWTHEFEFSVSAAQYDLYKDASLAQANFASGSAYNPGDNLTHTYAIRALNVSCSIDSAGSDFADADSKPDEAAITSIQDVDTCALSGIRVHYTGGTGANYHELVMGSTVVATPYASGAVYEPGDTSPHSYKVRAVNEYGYNDSQPQNGTDANNGLATPSAPGVTDVAPCAQSGVTVTWDTVSGATAYDLRLDGATVYSGVTSPYGYNPGNTASHTYEVRGRNAICTGAWSPATAFSDSNGTPSQPAITGITDVSPCATSGIQIAYTAGSPATRHDLYKDGVLAVTGYTSGAVYSVGDNSTHSYVVRAVNGTCAASSSSWPGTDVNNAVTAPGLPNVDDLADCAPSGLTVTWSPVSGATGYDLRVGGSAGTIVTDVASGLAYNPGTTATRTYEVRAKNASCTSGWSSARSAADNNYAPAAPVLSAVTDVAACAASGVTLAWNTVPNANYYDLLVDGVTTVSNIGSPPQVYTPGDTNPHHYQVRGRNTYCTGQWFNPNSYANAGGTGDRRSSITVTSTLGFGGSTVDTLINGTTTSGALYFSQEAIAGKYIQFDFGAGNGRVVTEARFYQSITTQYHGVWKWQGSADASTWTDLGGTFLLGGASSNPQVLTSLAGNATAYRYYRLTGVSGNNSANPYLYEIEFRTGSLSYANAGGSGDRRASIAVTTSLGFGGSTVDTLINGTTASGALYFSQEPVAGKHLTFDFGAGEYRVIDEARFYQSAAWSHGIWKWQGSLDGASWTDIGDTFTLGGATVQTLTTLNANSTAYRFYRLLGVSGTNSANPYLYEFEFRIGSAGRAGTDANLGVGTLAAPGVTDGSGCARSGVSISYGTDPNATSYELRVDGNDGSIVTMGTNPYVYSPGDGVSHSYQVRGKNGSCTGGWSAGTSGTDADNTPTPTISGPASNTCPASTVTLTTEAGMSAYQWYVGGSPISGAHSNTYVVSASGTYTVAYTNGAGCSGTSTGHAVTITPCAGPPAMGDGADAGGNPASFVKAAGWTADPPNHPIDVTYDTTRCPSAKTVILYGRMDPDGNGNLSDADFTGYYACALSNGGNGGATSFDSTAQGNVWYNIVWVSAAGVAGHPGFARDATLGVVARTWSANGLCGATDIGSYQTCP
jgi:hypothetical protein